MATLIAIRASSYPSWASDSKELVEKMRAIVLQTRWELCLLLLFIVVAVFLTKRQQRVVALHADMGT